MSFHLHLNNNGLYSLLKYEIGSVLLFMVDHGFGAQLVNDGDTKSI